MKAYSNGVGLSQGM